MINAIKTILKKLIRRVTGFAIREHTAPLEAQLRAQDSRIQQLDTQVLQLSEFFLQLSEFTEAGWLLKNADERMDANLLFFDKDRRQFHLDRYLFASRYCNSKAVADIACGTGYGSQVLSRDGEAASLIGIDISDEAVEYANKVYSSDKCRFVCRNAAETGLPDCSVDLVVSFETIEHVKNEEDLIDEFFRILKPGGMLISSVPNDWALETTPHHERKYDYDSFRKCLERKFRLEEIYNQNSGKGTFNRDRPREMFPTTEENRHHAECFVAICYK